MLAVAEKGERNKSPAQYAETILCVNKSDASEAEKAKLNSFSEAKVYDETREQPNKAGHSELKLWDIY